jgi:hypothetical protein
MTVSTYSVFMLSLVDRGLGKGRPAVQGAQLIFYKI